MRTHLVTGGTKGIGEALVRSLSLQGDRVFFTGRSGATGNKIAEELKAQGAEVEFFVQDVTDPNTWQWLVEQIGQRRHGLHSLVNNAGIHSMKPIDDYSIDDFHKLIGTNLLGVFLGTKHCLPMLVQSSNKNNPASVVNVSSVAGLVGAPCQSLYNMTKGGLELFSKSIALETGAKRQFVKVNTVCPGIIETDMGEGLKKQFAETGLVKDLATANRVLRSGYAHNEFPSVNDVVQSINFLLDPAGPYLTGVSIPVDRGFTAA